MCSFDMAIQTGFSGEFWVALVAFEGFFWCMSFHVSGKSLFVFEGGICNQYIFSTFYTIFDVFFGDLLHSEQG